MWQGRAGCRGGCAARETWCERYTGTVPTGSRGAAERWSKRIRVMCAMTAAASACDAAASPLGARSVAISGGVCRQTWSGARRARHAGTRTASSLLRVSAHAAMMMAVQTMKAVAAATAARSGAFMAATRNNDAISVFLGSAAHRQRGLADPLCHFQQSPYSLADLSHSPPRMPVVGLPRSASCQWPPSATTVGW